MIALNSFFLHLKEYVVKKKSCGINFGARENQSFLSVASIFWTGHDLKIESSGWITNSPNHNTLHSLDMICTSSPPMAGNLALGWLQWPQVDCKHSYSSGYGRCFGLLSPLYRIFPYLGRIFHRDFSTYQSLTLIQLECQSPFSMKYLHFTLIEITAFLIADHTQVLHHINAKSSQIYVFNCSSRPHTIFF